MLGQYFQAMNQPFEERYIKSLERIQEIVLKKCDNEHYENYFHLTGQWILIMADLCEKLGNAYFETLTFEELYALNKSLYSDILEENYDESYGNPEKCSRVFGEEMGQCLTYLYTKVINYVPLAFEGQKFRMALMNELFIRIYDNLQKEDAQLIRQFILEEALEAIDLKAEVFVLRRYDPQFQCYSDLMYSTDFKDLRYLFSYGMYISEDEIKTAQYLLSLSEDQIVALANVFTEAFYKGYIINNKEVPLSEKESVIIAYPIGFERLVRKTVENFKDMGLKPIVYSDEFTTPRPRLISTRPNQQFAYDHRFDEALFLNKEYTRAYETAYGKALEDHKVMIRQMAGIALQERFGEQPFAPRSKASSINYNDFQTVLKKEHTTAINQLVNKYAPRSAWSFAIIAYPIPSIGENYKAIFDEMIKVNTLDSGIYDKIQKVIIDTLDLGQYVHVLGKGLNKTDIRVMLHELSNPEKETNFENCTADLNIPVGEVYTTPMLKGTTGTIHVSQVYLYNLKYENLEISFKDGRIDHYHCTNFDSDEENKKYVYENLIHPHKSLPLGEFAIGTNTTAYVMSKKYQIQNRLPILIAEKMGPHFAIGDTCYLWSEDVYVANSDGKEIVAKDNEVSILRKTDLSKAYTDKHTDITIPYDELALIEVVTKEGVTIPVIKDGRFVLPGTELLNEPFNY